MLGKDSLKSTGGNASLNTVLLMSGLVCATLYQTEWGLQGSMWNILGGALISLFLLLNFAPRPQFVFLTGIPVALGWISLVMNTSSVLGLNSLRSVGLTSLGFLLLGTRPAPLNRSLLRRFLVAYLTVCLGLAMVRYAALPPGVPNTGFHVNPDGAAQLFFVCAVVAMFFFRSRYKWLVTGFSGLLITTTFATGAAAATVIVIALHGAFARVRGAFAPEAVLRITLRIAVVATGLSVMAYLFFPEYAMLLAQKFTYRLTSEGMYRARGFIWSAAFRVSAESPMSIFFGVGPARGSTAVVVGAHSAYLEAILSYGYPYMIACVLALILWTAQVVRRGHVEILALSAAMLAWGVTETLMFSGLRLPWLLLVLSGIYMESRDEPETRPQPSGLVPSPLRPRLRTPLAEAVAGRGAAGARPMRPHVST